MDHTDALIQQLTLENQRLIVRNDELWQMIREQFSYIKSDGKKIVQPAQVIPLIAADSVNDTTLADAISDAAVSFHDPPEIDDPMDRFVSPLWDPNWSNVTVDEQNERDLAEAQAISDVEASLYDESPQMTGDRGLG